MFLENHTYFSLTAYSGTNKTGYTGRTLVAFHPTKNILAFVEALPLDQDLINNAAYEKPAGHARLGFSLPINIMDMTEVTNTHESQLSRLNLLCHFMV